MTTDPVEFGIALERLWLFEVAARRYLEEPASSPAFAECRARAVFAVGLSRGWQAAAEAGLEGLRACPAPPYSLVIDTAMALHFCRRPGRNDWHFYQLAASEARLGRFEAAAAHLAACTGSARCMRKLLFDADFRAFVRASAIGNAGPAARAFFRSVDWDAALRAALAADPADGLDPMDVETMPAKLRRLLHPGLPDTYYELRPLTRARHPRQGNRRAPGTRGI